jgi:nitrogen fixation NifU-like protein
VKIHCSVLAEDAIKSAIDDYRKKQEARRAALATPTTTKAVTTATTAISP